MSGAALDARAVVARAGFRLDAHVRMAEGEIVALMGPSGAGKSTLLGVLAGLVGLHEGRVSLGDRVLDAAPRPRTHVTPAQRRIVLLGQDPRLFPHMTAHANIAFARRVHGTPAGIAATEAYEWLSRVGLDGLGARRPGELSGGQQQRVALARALATRPAALLLDEPLAQLDSETAGDIRALLHDQLAATRTTTLIATHDSLDAIALASRLVVLEAGRVTQVGPTRDVLAAPATRFVAAVSGLNRVPGDVRGGRFTAGSLAFAASGIADGPAAAVFAPSDVHLAPAAPAAEGEWSTRIARLEQTAGGVRVRVTDPDIAIDVSVDDAITRDLAPGREVTLRLDPAGVRLLESGRDETGDRPGQ